ncbi:MAG: tetratricopeptide repeat protein [Bacteroidetes bacterium]|nr:tetratricopeptide repeat protein [Bacteroidota bacterium]
MVNVAFIQNCEEQSGIRLRFACLSLFRMKSRFLFSATLILIASSVFGQSKSSRSLESQEVLNAELFESLNKANNMMNSKPEEALTEVESALTKSYSTGNKRGEAYSYQTLGAIHYSLNNFLESVSYYEKALEEFKKLNDSKALYSVYKHLGAAYESNKQFKKAIDIYSQFLKMATNSGNVEDEIQTKESLGRLLFNTGKYTEAKNYYQQLLSYYQSKQEKPQITGTYDNIGKCFAGLKDTTMALRYFKLAGTLADTEIPEEQQVNAYRSVGNSYNSVGKYEVSNEYEKKALKVNKKTGNKAEMWTSNSIIANNYLFMNRANEAIPFLKENINLSEELGEIKNSGETYRALSDAYVQLGRIDDAKKTFEKYKSLQEEILTQREEELNQRDLSNSSIQNKEKQIALLVRDKELDEQRIDLLEKQKSLQEQTNHDQRRINYFLIGAMLLLGVGILILFRSIKQKQLANKLLSIRSLRSQMNPHFIFNSLNSVNSFISKSDDRSANKYLTEFARLMRTVLEHSKKDFVTLSEEISVLEKYLNLEHLRFHEHFEFELYVDEDLDSERLLIPPMLVQPYIENAIWHGLRYRETTGKLNVSFIAEEENIRIEIIDNGIGRERSEALKTRNQKDGKSTGISNTKSRLELLNQVHKIRLSADIRNLEEDGSGTVVIIHLPYIDIDEKKYAET